MKKLFYLMAVASLFLAMPLTSCSDDDDDENTTQTEGNVSDEETQDNEEGEEGENTCESEELDIAGYLYVMVGSEIVDPVQQDVTVETTCGNTFTLFIPDFSFTYGEGEEANTIPLGDVEVECELSGTDFIGSTTVNYYGFDIDFDIEGTFDGESISFSSAFSAIIIDVAFVYEGSINGVSVNDNVDWTFTLSEYDIADEDDAEEIGGTASVTVAGTSVTPTSFAVTTGDNKNGQTVISISTSILVDGTNVFTGTSISNIALLDNGDGTYSVQVYGGGLLSKEYEVVSATTCTVSDDSIVLEFTYLGKTVAITFTVSTEGEE